MSLREHHMRYDLRKIGKKAGPQAVSPNHIKNFVRISFSKRTDIQFRKIWNSERMSKIKRILNHLRKEIFLDRLFNPVNMSHLKNSLPDTIPELIQIQYLPICP